MADRAQAATTYYVEPAPYGSDTEPGWGQSASFPFATIQHAIDQCTNSAETYTIYVKGGYTYNPTQNANGDYYFLIFDKQNLTIVPMPSTGTPILNGLGIYPRNPSGLAQPGTIGLLQICDSKNVTISGLKVFQSGQAGITIRETRMSTSDPVSNIVIESCIIDDTWASGINVMGLTTSGVATTAQPTNITIWNNEIKKANRANEIRSPQVPVNPGGEAIHIFNVNWFWIHDNYVHSFFKEGINCVHRIKNGYVYRNRVGSRAPTSTYGNQTGAGIYADGWASGVGEYSALEIFSNYVYGLGPGIVVNTEAGGHVQNVDIYNNVVNTTGNCFAMGEYAGSRKNVHVYNNTFVHTNSSFNEFVAVIRETDLTSIDGFEFKNNIVARSFGAPQPLFFIEPPGASYTTHANMTISYNLYWDNGTSLGNDETHGTFKRTGDPSLGFGCLSKIPGDPSAFCFIGLGSDAKDQGVSIAKVSDDIEGVWRPSGASYDIGAIEVITP